MMGGVLLFCILTVNLLNLDLVSSMDVLMVTGGRYLDNGRQAHQELATVEVLGPRGSCKLPDMPEPRHGHTAALIGTNVVVCGGTSGKHIYERRECMKYSLRTGKWSIMLSSPPKGLAFSAVAVSKNSLYLVGGRESLYKSSQDRPWKSTNLVMEYSQTRLEDMAWRFLPNLTRPGSDGCAGVIGGSLWYVGEEGVEVLKVGEYGWREVQVETLENYTSWYEPDPVQYGGSRPSYPNAPVQSSYPLPTRPGPYNGIPRDVIQDRQDAGRAKIAPGPGLAAGTNKVVNLDLPTNDPLLPDQDGDMETREERRRRKEEERRRKNEERMRNLNQPGSIWDQLRNVFDKGSKGVDDIFKMGEHERVKRQVTRPPWRDDGDKYTWTDGKTRYSFNKPTRAPWYGDSPGMYSQVTRPPLDSHVPPSVNYQDNRGTSSTSRGSQSFWDQNPSQIQWNSRGDADRHNQQSTRIPNPRSGPGADRPTSWNNQQSRRPTPVTEKRVGQGCFVTQVAGEEGLIMAGGVYGGGNRVYWLPAERPGTLAWEEIGRLNEARRWRPGLGRIAGRLVVAGGGDYGSDTIEALDNNQRFQVLPYKMKDKRENLAAVTVDSSFFPNCNL